MNRGLLTCGEAMACLTAPDAGPLRTGGAMRLSIAGAESNVAIGVARLGHRSTFIGCVGRDELGELVLRTLRAEGVDIEAARREDAPTGLMLKERRVGTVTRVHYYRTGSAGARLDASHIDEGLVASAGVVHVTGITPALGEGPGRAVDAMITAARRHGIPVAFVVNYRQRLWPSTTAARRALGELAARADYVFASDDELALIGDDGAGATVLLHAGVKAVVVTRGAAGADLWTEHGMVHRPALTVTAVDTVGAGDALCAGFLSGVLDGIEPDAALQRGVCTAAFSVATTGDWEGLPTRSELSLLANGDGATQR